MANITTHYKIPGPVEFLDVDVSMDNRMFMDPHAIRLQHHPEPYVSQANRATETFFRKIAGCVLSRDENDRRHGLDLLQHFEEPWETRLGLARDGFRGHGGADDVGSSIWQSMTTDAEVLLRVGILTQIEDLPLFVDGIDRDITSDITTRIIFEPLANFTAEMIEKYPQLTSLGHRVQKFQRQVWDADALNWKHTLVDLPIAEGKPILLVPRNWARPTLLMSAGRYYETSVLTYAQLEQAVRTHDGKLLMTTKDVLKNQSALARGRRTNLRVTRRAETSGQDLLAYFKAFVDSRYEELDEDEINRRIA
jgi:hypothetical protein